MNNKIIKPMKGLSPNHRLIKEYKNSLTHLSNEQWQASIGLMLGDASLQTQDNKKSYRLKFEWGNKNKPYVNHVHTLFNDWISSDPHKKVRININNNEVINWGFQTFSHTAFNPLADLFLQSGKKGIADQLITNHLTSRGLAYWFMDDGGKLDYNKGSSNKGLVLNTHSFQNQEVDSMCDQLAAKFSLECETRFNKSKKVIVIKSNSYDKFLELTDDYLLDEMRYKLPSTK